MPRNTIDAKQSSNILHTNDSKYRTNKNLTLNTNLADTYASSIKSTALNDYVSYKYGKNDDSPVNKLSKTIERIEQLKNEL